MLSETCNLFSLKDAISALKEKKIVLIHDFNERENETDMVCAAENITPSHIAKMRKEAGGLICVAIRFDIAQKLELPYMSDILHIASKEYPTMLELINSHASYGRSAFSISVNYKDTFTGITDYDRYLTIEKLSKICKSSLQKSDVKHQFASNFRSPGHVNLLIASDGLISKRLGHTELSVYLTQLSGLTPVAVICEMLDDGTHRSLSTESAQHYAKKNGIPYLEGKDIVSYYKAQERNNI